MTVGAVHHRTREGLARSDPRFQTYTVGGKQAPQIRLIFFAEGDTTGLTFPGCFFVVLVVRLSLRLFGSFTVPFCSLRGG